MENRRLKNQPIYSHTKKYKDPYSATVKDYGGHKKKLTVCKMRVRESGLVGAFEHSPRDDTEKPPPDLHNGDPPASAVSSNKSPPAGVKAGKPHEKPPEATEERFACNLSRARSTIFELALCNDWQWFITFTLDPEKYDRTDLKKFRKDLSRFIRNYRSKKGANVKYLLIPEQHSDGINWHMHGFLMGLPESHLRLFTLEDYIPYYIREKLARGDLVYEWESYSRKFGFCDIEPIRDLESTAKYATKYVSKSIDNGIIESHGHLYYASQGLKRATVTAKGYYDPSLGVQFEFENEYVKLKWFGGDEHPEDLIHDDNTAAKLRQRRDTIKARPPDLPSFDPEQIPWEPMWDTETGEIFSDPFSDPASFKIVTVDQPASDSSPPKLTGRKEQTRHKRNNKQTDGQINLDLDTSNF